MKIITDLSTTSAPHRARHGWKPDWLFRSGAQGAWYDPSDLTTLYQDVSGTLPVTADGDPVALMLDKSGNDNHATQPIVAARPTWRSDGNLCWLEHDGVDDQMFIPIIPYSTPLSMSVFIGLHRFAGGGWSTFRSAAVLAPEFATAGASNPTDPGLLTNTAGGNTRVDGQVFTGGRIALHAALQVPRVGGALNNTTAAFLREGTFFAMANLRPPGRVFAYVECENVPANKVALIEHWVAGKTGVAL